MYVLSDSIFLEMALSDSVFLEMAESLCTQVGSMEHGHILPNTWGEALQDPWLVCVYDCHQCVWGRNGEKPSPIPLSMR